MVMAANLVQHSTALRPISYGVGQTMMNLGIACIIDRFVRFPNGHVGRLLNAAPVAFLGTISYSLYLWQQPFLNRRSTENWSAFPLNVTLAFAAAILSHYLVERPFLAWRTSLERSPPSIGRCKKTPSANLTDVKGSIKYRDAYSPR
jgi:peptidoglycan/LPS O-acetylase OafA/YrhL